MEKTEIIINNRYIQNYLSTVFKQLIISTILRDAFLWINGKKIYFSLLISVLKKHTLLKFNGLMDIWAVDFPERHNRFQLNYLLNSSVWESSAGLRYGLENLEPQKSLTSTYLSAGWLEREVWDMHGIKFEGNPDLRRILTDYGFEGFPLRKDFPLTGYYELRYSHEQKRLSVYSLELIQEFRFFYFNKQWSVN